MKKASNFEELITCPKICYQVAKEEFKPRSILIYTTLSPRMHINQTIKSKSPFQIDYSPNVKIKLELFQLISIQLDSYEGILK